MKEIVFFGSGTVAEKNLRMKPIFIVDNNKDLQGTVFHGIEIRDPEDIRGKSDRYSVMVCTTSIDAVRPQLQALGYGWEKDADAAPQLKEILAIDKLERTKFRFVISSGLPSHSANTAGGGVFLVEELHSGTDIKKIFQGNVHGLIKGESGAYYFNAQGDGIYQLSSDLNLEPEKVLNVPKGLRPHGMVKHKGDWLLVSSYDDALIQLNSNGEEVRRYKFSNKKTSYESAQHHCNDVSIHGGFAYVSMFSVTGNWKRGIFDGGVVEICLETGNQRTILNTLTMPHNISFFQDEMRIMNSFKGEVLTGNFDVYGTLPGFVRGYDEDDSFMIIGESKNRNFSRLDAGRSPVSIDTRITIIEKEYKACRSIQIPKTISEIHSIIRV